MTDTLRLAVRWKVFAWEAGLRCAGVSRSGRGWRDCEDPSSSFPRSTGYDGRHVNYGGRVLAIRL